MTPGETPISENEGTIELEVDGREEQKTGIERRDGGGFTLHLSEPITFKPSKMDAEKTVDRLDFPAKLKGKHLKAMDQAEGEMGKTLALIASAAGVPKQATDELDSRDITLAMGELESFLPMRPATGS